jgi:hypothetical protein
MTRKNRLGMFIVCDYRSSVKSSIVNMYILCASFLKTSFKKQYCKENGEFGERSYLRVVSCVFTEKVQKVL